MCSDDPKELVNNIPIGPAAAMVKVVKVVKKDAYLWRPTPDMYLIGHALEEYVVWPIKNTSPKASSPIASSHKSASPGV